MRNRWRAILALMVMLGSLGLIGVATEPAAAQGSYYVGWEDHKGCDSDGLHWRFTEHAMYRTSDGLPDHKRFYLSVLHNGNMVHRNAYHGSAPYDVYPATVIGITYPFVHYNDPTDYHHCRFVLAKWNAGGHVGQLITGDGGEWGFSSGSIGTYLMYGGQSVGGWEETSNWVLTNQDCDADPPVCQWNNSGGTSAYWWNRYGMTYPDGTTQYPGELWAESFVDGL